MTLSAQCIAWAEPIFEEVFAGVEVAPSDVRFGNGDDHLGISVLRDKATKESVEHAARLLAGEARRRGMRRFVQLDLPTAVESAARSTHSNGLSFRACEVYQPHYVSSGGTAVAEMWVVRFDVAGMPSS